MSLLPTGWKITRYPTTIELENEHGKVMTCAPVPYDPMSMQELVNRAMETLNKKNTSNFMAVRFEDYRDEATGDINLTLLAEAAADKCGLEGALDDETHWVWEMAAEYFDR